MENLHLQTDKKLTRPKRGSLDSNYSVNSPVSTPGTPKCCRACGNSFRKPLDLRRHERTCNVDLLERFSEAELTQFREIFIQVDTDGNGKLDRGEIEAVVARAAAMGFEASDDALSMMFEEMDTDGDGNIAFEEFCSAMKSGAEARPRRMSANETVKDITKHELQSQKTDARLSELQRDESQRQLGAFSDELSSARRQRHGAWKVLKMILTRWQAGPGLRCLIGWKAQLMLAVQKGEFSSAWQVEQLRAQLEALEAQKPRKCTHNAIHMGARSTDTSWLLGEGYVDDLDVDEMEALFANQMLAYE
eukprot:TRINITY_DN14370_c0_g1_i1.p1 TRINITY_DN14370_c0_g1~~TRINITY_DN14370_c0_g1_i1.p1  ORF type:complete len:305 (-),score=62.97 TRINITY_DN14370_c0_g1_i1:316-1230(-)